MNQPSELNTEHVHGSPPRWQFSLAQLMFVTMLAAFCSWWFRMHFTLGVFFTCTIAGIYLGILRTKAELRIRHDLAERPPGFEKQLFWIVLAIGGAACSLLWMSLLIGALSLLVYCPMALTHSLLSKTFGMPDLPDWSILIGLPAALPLGARYMWKTWPQADYPSREYWERKG